MLINQIDNSGYPIGLWEYYHGITGNLYAKGFWKNGKKNGYWEHYYLDGKINRDFYLSQL